LFAFINSLDISETIELAKSRGSLFGNGRSIPLSFSQPYLKRLGTDNKDSSLALRRNNSSNDKPE
jgi:hypothetical protein